LSWQAPPPPVFRYLINRAVGNTLAGAQQIGIVLVTPESPTRFFDTTAAAGATYTYSVVAQYDSAEGPKSIDSDPFTITTPAPTTAVIDFEEFTGGPVFSEVQPPLTVGIATISGGQLLQSTTNLPADQTVVYGTASPNLCTGCESTITIDFTQGVSNFSVFLMNGRGVIVTYVVQDDQGGTQTHTLEPTLSSGAVTVSLPASGITHVEIRPTGEPTLWDFLIDNIQFTYNPGGPIL
jgi:hypothetical protein